jgi:signal transduction histidine kinase
MIRWIALLALANFVSGRLALMLAIPPGYVTAIWPPVGISLAVVLIKGRKVLPGVWLGSFAINLSMAQNGLSSVADCYLPACIALGSTCAIFFADLSIKKFLAWPNLIAGEKNIFKFLLLSGPCNAWISAGLGTLSLFFMGAIGGAQAPHSFFTWWVGDSIGGMLLTGPLLVIFHQHFKGASYQMRWRLSLIPLIIALLFVSMILFHNTQHDSHFFGVDSWYVLVIGLSLSAFLAGILMVMASRSLEIDKIVEQKTKDIFEANLQLQEEIALRIQLEQDLRENTKKIEQASISKSHFIARMSHEIRTPINSIRAPSKMILDQPDLSDDSRTLANMIHSSSEHLCTIIDDILDFSRLDSGLVQESLVPLKLKEHFLEIEKKWIPWFQQKKLGFKILFSNLSDEHLWIDVQLLDTIVQKLLDNAYKFTDQGQIEINIKGLGVTETGSQSIELKVSDTGIGINPKFLSQMYNAFEQEEDSLTRRFEGLGLGLSIVSRMVQLMGGQLSCESTLKQGSTFTLRWAFKPCAK